ncbi:MAG: ACP S-malonyltransferase [Gammaproteobacteria bacterium]
MSFVVVFPGQGSQAVGMLAELAEAHASVAATFEEASDALGFDLHKLIREGPADTLNRTENTQPALLAAGIAVWRLWEEQGGAPPAALAGHSLGEYTALAAAGVFGFADALRLVRLRGQFMQEAVPAGTGAMAAIIGLDAAAVGKTCAAVRELGIVSPANLNSPTQIVISGERAAVEKAGVLASEAGAKRVIPLAVSVPSHCALMRPAAERLAAALAELDPKAPTIPVVNNADVAAPNDPTEIADALVRQLTQPVRWTEVVENLRDDYQAETLLEFGPGAVLTGLGRRIDRSLKGFAVNDPVGLDAALAATQ